MNSYLTPQNTDPSVVYLRNSRAHAPDKYDSGRLDGNNLSRNLLRPELISAPLATSMVDTPEPEPAQQDTPEQ